MKKQILIALLTFSVGTLALAGRISSGGDEKLGPAQLDCRNGNGRLELLLTANSFTAGRSEIGIINLDHNIDYAAETGYTATAKLVTKNGKFYYVVEGFLSEAIAQTELSMRLTVNLSSSKGGSYQAHLEAVDQKDRSIDFSIMCKTK